MKLFSRVCALALSIAGAVGTFVAYNVYDAQKSESIIDLMSQGMPGAQISIMPNDSGSTVSGTSYTSVASILNIIYNFDLNPGTSQTY